VQAAGGTDAVAAFEGAAEGLSAPERAVLVLREALDRATPSAEAHRRLTDTPMTAFSASDVNTRVRSADLSPIPRSTRVRSADLSPIPRCTRVRSADLSPIPRSTRVRSADALTTG
jgi:hypothetical protein